MGVRDYSTLYTSLTRYYDSMTAGMIDCEIESGNKSVSVGATHLRNAASHLYNYITAESRDTENQSINSFSRSLCLATISYRMQLYCVKTEEFVKILDTIRMNELLRSAISAEHRQELRDLIERINQYQADAQSTYDTFHRIENAIMQGLTSGMALPELDWDQTDKTLKERAMELDALSRRVSNILLETRKQVVLINH